METRHILRSYKETLLFLLIFVFATALYLFNINFSDLWIDETFTKALISHPLTEVFKYLTNDFHPPLYYIGLKVFTYFTGISGFTIRLFSVIGGLCTLLISYVVGQRILGKTGALWFCLMLVSLPMLTSYTHDARMYTWAAFMTTGVFLYSVLYMKTQKNSDLIFLGLFSLMAAYTHYYCLMAAFWSNAFVLIYLLINRNRAWRAHTLMGLIVFICFLPWLTVFINQTKAAHNDFWIPEVTPSIVLSCYFYPFGEKIYLPISTTAYFLIAILYGLTVISIIASIYKSIRSQKDDHQLALGLSFFIFNMTILAWLILSITFKPLIYPRYIMCMVTMLMVPPAIFFMSGGIKWLKVILSGVVMCLGVYISIAGSYFSYGPYKQSAEYLADKHPDIKKIVNFHEILVGPLMEYDKNKQLTHYLLKNKNTALYTNMAVFDGLHEFNKLDDILKKDELFCVPNFPFFTLNQSNLDLILSQSQVVNIDEVIDNKAYGSKILLYILKYQGNK
jgi:4-amino-4-deoxy-L-arabinose transferase-like glycosyltransferase